ncbi:type II toxin-antitoxin system VapB family antitoxin [Sulfuriroseicoccus oceanibius]|uniref:Type II toxin-antitoxin system VapB family antitoxin n=1 Tax=Sulfuriroseicoccus oceanibius TaxID=2707525 RepID=A0A6B3LE35_9BACT|nr:type II toxin-antitoxin system VapB family antitoxin [Sulfuriroseicoccus oceanibius]QQL45884.1 type II toxin-antitoxin system VapB family antitoxin [Sulfuriroseicoccus oceanibius]
MRTTVTIDDELFAEAAKITGESSASPVINAALKALVAAESRKRLQALAGSAPGFTVPPRDQRSMPICVADDPQNYPSENP